MDEEEARDGFEMGIENLGIEGMEVAEVRTV